MILDEFFGKILNKQGIDFKETLRLRNARFLEIFTTNYDMVVENYCRSRGLLYENGERRFYICGSTFLEKSGLDISLDERTSVNGDYRKNGVLDVYLIF